MQCLTALLICLYDNASMPSICAHAIYPISQNLSAWTSDVKWTATFTSWFSDSTPCTLAAAGHRRDRILQLHFDGRCLRALSSSRHALLVLPASAPTLARALSVLQRLRARICGDSWTTLGSTCGPERRCYGPAALVNPHSTPHRPGRTGTAQAYIKASGHAVLCHSSLRL